MTSSFYKLKRHRLVSGVLAGLADKFGLSVTLLRFLFILFTLSHAFIGVIIYLLLDDFSLEAIDKGCTEEVILTFCQIILSC